MNRGNGGGGGSGSGGAGRLVRRDQQRARFSLAGRLSSCCSLKGQGGAACTRGLDGQDLFHSPAWDLSSGGLTQCAPLFLASQARTKKGRPTSSSPLFLSLSPCVGAAASRRFASLSESISACMLCPLFSCVLTRWSSSSPFSFSLPLPLPSLFPLSLPLPFPHLSTQLTPPHSFSTRSFLSSLSHLLFLSLSSVSSSLSLPPATTKVTSRRCISNRPSSSPLSPSR